MTVTQRGSDLIDAEDECVDEIKQYYDCRYLFPCESAWRIFAFDIHQRWPPVQRLIFHLPREQNVMFQETDSIHDILLENRERNTMFIAWMEANKKYLEGKNLTYGEFPAHFVYNINRREWYPRKKGFCIGKINFVLPTNKDLFYLRLLLNIQKGCTSIEDLRTAGGFTHQTFREACYALGLLTDDREFIDAIKEAANLSLGPSLRRLFVTLLLSQSMNKPLHVWEQTWQLLVDGILYEKRREVQRAELLIEDGDLQNLCLIEIEKMLMVNGRTLNEFNGMPVPTPESVSRLDNVLLLNELNYSIHEMLDEHNKYFPHLTDEQLKVYYRVIDAVNSSEGGFYFVHGYGGTGKTFIWKTLSAKIRAERKVVLNVASSGIASLLLPGGRTAHSTFAIPLQLNEDSICNLKPNSPKANLIKYCSLIIWDEAPMTNKWAFEALDRTLRDLIRVMGNDNCSKPFGGKVVVLGGDF